MFDSRQVGAASRLLALHPEFLYPESVTGKIVASGGLDVSGDRPVEKWPLTCSTEVWLRWEVLPSHTASS